MRWISSRLLSLCFVILVALAAAGTALAADVNELVTQLSAKLPSDREAAADELARMGPQAAGATEGWRRH
ncbi:MAG: hypothetical protein R3C10_14835 [Pirellulales bacterium]